MHGRQKLNNKLNKYIELVINYFKLVSKENENRKPIYEHKSKEKRLFDAVVELESENILDDLANYLSADYYDILNENRSDEWQFDGMPPDMQLLITNFFRRSSFYIMAFNNEEIDKEQLINLFWEAFLAKEVIVRYLAPLEFVEFATNKPMDFGFFLIRKFSKEELYKISNNEINKIFYSDCVWDNIETLAKYWFIDVPNVKILTDSLIRGVMGIIKTNNKIKRLHYLEPINDILNKLILYKWNQKNEEMVCQGFKIPFVIQIDEYPIAYPESSPDMTMLTTDIQDVNDIYLQWTGAFDFEKIKRGIEYKVKKYFLLNRGQTKIFIKHVHKINKIYDKDIFEVWPFMRTAFNYLQKALFTYEDSRLIEQFLLYIMVIEALLGENKDSLTKLMASRLSRILGKDNNERDKIYKQFDNKKMIYDTRSRLIHGKKCTKERIIKNLSLGRELSQNACIWFLIYLGNILKMYKKKGKMPDREDILRIIDLESEQRKSINQLSKITEKRLKSFPYIKIS